jgi:hypothetical protein
VRFGARLGAFAARMLQQRARSDLVSLDARAFRVPVLKDLV